jgi:integrase
MTGLDMARRLSPESLRRTFAGVAKEFGVDFERRQRALGHIDPRSTQHYDHLASDLDDDPGLVLGPLYADRSMFRLRISSDRAAVS